MDCQRRRIGYHLARMSRARKEHLSGPTNKVSDRRMLGSGRDTSGPYPVAGSLLCEDRIGLRRANQHVGCRLAGWLCRDKEAAVEGFGCSLVAAERLVGKDLDSDRKDGGMCLVGSCF